MMNIRPAYRRIVKNKLRGDCDRGITTVYNTIDLGSVLNLCDNSLTMKMEDKKYIYLLVGLPAIVFSLFIGIYIGNQQSGSVQSIPNDGGDNSVMLNEEQFAPFWKAWQVLDEKYVAAASTTNEVKVWGAIQGLASSFGDPYTVFFPPVESKMFKEDIAGNFEGVGMEIGIKDKQLQVVAPIKGSPADRAGVKTGDFIISINGTSTVDMSTDQAVKLIRGPKGSVVKINFFTQGASKPVLKSIVRDVIDIPTLDASLKPEGVFVIRLFSFTAQSPNLFRNALREFVNSGSNKLILDLRGNPGGYLDAAWDMASFFLPAGKVVVTEDFGPNDTPNIFRSKGYNVFNKNLQMIILVDGGSASAAEILAGALSEQGIAKLVGVKTFGKGSVQELVTITPETSLKVTIARWLTPNGHNLSHEGLIPDVIIEVTDKDIADKRDAQMEKAIKILTVGE
jgi:carboxyl-terminal processing protease